MTDLGEAFTHGTVWLALTLYVASELAARRSHLRAARSLNAIGCAAFLAHVVCAFQFYDHWSHSAAYAETARQTAQLTGWNSGVGLYINYLFALVWIATVITPPRGVITGVVRGFFLFMVFNGAVVFVHSPIRWFGLLLCVALIGCWLIRK
jgi:hypothetical protein